jgi:phage terminase small subunit
MAVTRAQKRFLDYYIGQDFRNATEAYRKAYPEASYDTARANSTKLLAKTYIQEYMSSIITEALEREKFPLEKRLFDYWVRRAFYDVTEIIDLHGKLKFTEEQLREKGLHVCIDSINRKTDAQGREIITYKFADKDKAADMLQRYIQMIREKITVDLKDDSRLVDLKNLLFEKAEQSPEERERIIAGLEKAAGNNK